MQGTLMKGEKEKEIESTMTRLPLDKDDEE